MEVYGYTVTKDALFLKRWTCTPKKSIGNSKNSLPSVPHFYRTNPQVTTSSTSIL